MGIGEGRRRRKKVEQAADALTAIVGQNRHHSLAQVDRHYKLRDGQAIGCKVSCAKRGCTSS